MASVQMAFEVDTSSAFGPRTESSSDAERLLVFFFLFFTTHVVSRTDDAHANAPALQSE